MFLILFFFVGAGLLLFGFGILLTARRIEGISSSCVRDLKEGEAELQGKARKVQLLQSPLTKTECVLYQYKVEIDKSQTGSVKDIKIASGNSFSQPFLLEDATGKAIVFPSGAALMFPSTYRLKWRIDQEALPVQLQEFIAPYRRQYDFSQFSKVDFKEHCIKEGDEVYVLGTVKSKQGVDAGNLPGVSEFVIAQGDQKTGFIISNRSEKELLSKLRSQYIICFCLGAGLLIGTIIFYLGGK